MSVLTKRISNLAAAAILVGATVGCGGGLSGLPPVQPVPVNVNGGVTSVMGTATQAVVADGDSHTILVNVNGSNVAVVIPAGVSVAIGDQIAIIPDGTTPIIGLAGGARNPGDVFVNGKITRAHIVNGKLHPALGFPKGRFTLDGEGPFTVRQGTSVLTIQRVRFVFDSDGTSLSLPVEIAGKIPSNGSNNWQNSLSATYAAPWNNNTATLTITHANGTLNRTVNVGADGVATFTDFADDPQSHIPKQGVNLVTYTHVGVTPP